MKIFTITEDFPKSEIEFDKRFSDIDKCYDYLFQTIWPDGFCCKVCGHTKFWISAKHIYICTRCEHQHSLTADTIMDSSKKPVTYWFKAMWWFTTRRSGVNAINLQELLGLGSYGTAWCWLQKLRRCTIRKDREKLSGRVEVDEFYIGGKTSGKRGRGAASKTAVVAAVERDEKKKRIGRIRLKVIPDCSSMSLNTFVEQNVEPGSTIVTDAWRSYQSIDKERYAHIERNLTKTPDKESVLYGIHLVATLVKRLIRSTHQCRFEPRYLQNYLDEYVFRFNRRKSASIGKKFMRIFQQAVATSKITLEDILLDGHLAEINLSLGLYG